MTGNSGRLGWRVVPDEQQQMATRCELQDNTVCKYGKSICMMQSNKRFASRTLKSTRAKTNDVWGSVWIG
jgi:hypothetical protein